MTTKMPGGPPHGRPAGLKSEVTSVEPALSDQQVQAGQAGDSGFATAEPSQGHPVFSGLVALVAVALAVGAFLGLGALTASRVLGLGGNGSGTAASAGVTMYLPEPQSTSAAAGPLVTLAPGEPQAPSAKPPPASQSADGQTAIELVASPETVGSFERINLSGTYPAGDGSVLQVQRFEGGRWNDFSVTVSVNGGKFATYVQTSHSGRNKFRVLDRDRGTKSNPVFVTVR